MHYYSHHIGDFNSATRHLSRLERAIYRDLLDIYYESERPLTADFDRLARIALIGDDERATLRDILNEFFKLDETGYRNKRADAEITAYQAMREGGKRGAANRWSKGGDRVAIATPSTPQCQPVTMNHEPLTTNHEPIERASRASRRTRIPEDFWPNENGLAVANAKGCSVAVELGKFRDYHTAQGSTMADWQAAWRTWIGRVKPSGAAQSGETAYQRSMRERMEKFAPSVAAKVPGSKKPTMEVFDVAAKQLG